jgi:competence protein ComEC
VSGSRSDTLSLATCKSPLLSVAASFALGILLAHGNENHGTLTALAFITACALLLFGLIALRLHWLKIATLLAALGFVAAGAATSGLFESRFPLRHVSRVASLGVDLSDPVRLDGRLVCTPRRTAYGLQFDLDVHRLETRGQSHDLTGKVRLRVAASEDPETAALADSLHLQYGDSIRALVRLRKPQLYQNPGSFDYRRWMESIEDVTWVGTIKNAHLVEKLPRASSLRLAAVFAHTRQRLLQSIDRLYPAWSAEGRDGAVLKAVLWGDRSALDSETIENFRRTGLYHLLVIAGLHVGLLALLAGFLLRRLPLGVTSRYVVLLLLLLLYSGLVEQRASTLRATLMISVYLLGRLLYRSHTALNAVGLAALILLVHRPPWLFEAGFQLSFAAALLIAGLAVPILERTTEPYRRALLRLEEVRLDDVLAPRQAQFRLELRRLIAWLGGHVKLAERYSSLATGAIIAPLKLLLWTANMLIFSAILQLGLLLPMTETFHRVSLAGVGLNAAAIPLMTVLLAIALPTVLLGALWPALAVWPAKALTLVMSFLFWLTNLPRLPGWLSYRVPEPPVWLAGGFVIAVVAAAVTLGRRRRIFWTALAGSMIFVSLIAVHPFAPRLPVGALEVTALDCGAGDALFLVLPDRTTMLVDAAGTPERGAREGVFQGSRWDPGENIVSPYLWSRGIQRLDIVAVTHAHEDHLGGLAAVVSNFRVGEFWHGDNPLTPRYQALLDEVRRLGIPERRLAAGEVLREGRAQVRVLWPPPQRKPGRIVSNDDSLVLRITSAEGSVLLTGDISQEVERELLASGVRLESWVLKVAHHGSTSSSSPEFLARVAPRVALVPAESTGLVTLPNPETLERLRRAGARVFRTDTDGAVSVVMTARSLAIHREGSLPAVSMAGVSGATSAGAAIPSVR